MAKDVDLVIRARNEAEKVLNGLTTVLGNLVGKQDAVTASAAKTDSVLEKLKQEFVGLKREADGLASLGKISTSLDNATKSVERMTGTIQKQEKEIGELQSKANALGNTEATLRSQAQAASTALDRERQSLVQLKTEATSTTREIEKMTRELANLEKAAERQRSTPTFGVAQDRVASVGRGLQNELPGTNPRDSFKAILQGQIERSREVERSLTGRITSQEGVVNREQAALKTLEAQIKSTGGEQRNFQSQIDTAAAALERETASLAKAKAALVEIQEAAINAGSALSRVTGNQNASTEAANRVAQSQARVQAAIAATTATARASVQETPSQAGAVRQAQGQLQAAQAEVAKAQAIPVRQAEESQRDFIARLREAAATAKESAASIKADLKTVTAEASATEKQVTSIKSALDKLERDRQAPLKRGETEAARAQKDSERATAETQWRSELAALEQALTAQKAIVSTEQQRYDVAASLAKALKDQAAAVLEIERAEKRIGTAQKRATAANEPLKSDRDEPFSGMRPTRTQFRQMFADTELKNANSALDSAKLKLDLVNLSLEQHKTNATAAGHSVDVLVVETDKVTNSAAREAAALAEATAAVERHAQAQARLAAVQAQVAARIEGLQAKRAPVTPIEDGAAARIGALQRYKDTKTELTQVQDEANKLARSMKDSTNPTEDMGRALGEAQAKARLLKQELRQLREVISEQKNPKGGITEALARMGAGGSGSAPAIVPSNLPPIKPLGDDARRAGAGFKEGADGAISFRDAIKGLYGDSRESLSLMQRIRGEVLALATAYIGVTGAISGIKATVDAFKNLEAVQSRLGSVFSQDTQRVAVEVDFLKREATRLGVSFSVLANEYGKVAIAGREANFTSEETRKVFMSVAEAGRVTKLSQDQLSGVFLALTQMMSKGKVSSEELRRQLGDRLPGAFGLMAKALDMTEAQLTKAMEAGEVLANSTTLVKFADQLDKQYGGQLPAALRTFTTELGRMQNNLEQAALAVGEGGLIDALFRLTKAFNDLITSESGSKFFLSIGSAAGKVLDVFTTLLPYADKVAGALALIVGYKLGMFFATAATAAFGFAGSVSVAAVNSSQLTIANRALGITMTALDRQLAMAQVGMLALGTEAGVTSARFAVAAGAIGIFRSALTTATVAMRGLLTIFGGIPGIIATGLTIAAGYWLTSVEKTTEELSTHKRLIDEVVTKYEEAKDKSADWSKNIKDASLTKLLSELEIAKKSQKELEENLKNAGSISTMMGPATKDPSNQSGLQQIKMFTDLFRQGQMSAAEYKTALDKIGEANPKLRDNIILPLIEMADKAVRNQESLEKLEAVINLIKGTATDAQKKLLGLSESLKDTGAKQAAVDMKAFADALDAIKAKIPELSAQMKRMKTDAETFGEAMKALQALGWDPEKGGTPDPEKLKELTEAFGRANKASFDAETRELFKQYGGDKLPTSLGESLAGSEGLRTRAYRDIGGKPTIGFGATYKADGSPVEMGDVITKAEAVKLFVDNLSKFAAMVDAAVGNAKLTENQRNALISYVYNVGNTDGSEATRKIFASIRAGRPDAEVAQNIANGISTVNGAPSSALQARRKMEAGMYLSPDNRAGGQDSGATQYDRELAKRSAQNSFDEKIDKQIRDTGKNAADQKAINDAQNQSLMKRDLAIQNALLKAQNEAKEAGAELDAKRAEEIKKVTAAEWDANHVNDAAKEAEEKVNQLYAARKTLIEDLKVAKEQGDQTGIAAAEEGIRKMNVQIHDAIENAIKMWTAIGGTEADTAIAKLRLLEASTKKNKTEITTAGQINEKFASGMVNAFDQAASGIGQAIAGTKSWKEAIAGLGLAFLNFAAEFMRDIAKMILKALILQAIQSAMGMPGGVPGAGGGAAGGAGSVTSFGGLIAGLVNGAVAHTGGVVGQNAVGSNRTRMVDPTWFIGAPRFHDGGVPGLGKNEVATILEKQEEVLTMDDPRHVLNGGKNGGGGGGIGALKIVNLLDPKMITDAMQTTHGEKAMLTNVKANKDSIRQILGIK